jgi:hypothetical protein
VHRSLGVVMGHYRALLISQGREVGEG